MKHLISLLAFCLLIGCDGEKSNLAPSKDSPEETASEAPSKNSLGEQQKVTEEAKNTSLPPIPDPMDAEAIMKLWSMEHDPTGFIEEMKLPGRPGTWDGVASSGPVRNDWVQSEKFSVDEKWVGRRFTVAKYSHESNENHYSVFTYLPDEDSFIMWNMYNNGITQSKGERLEEGGIRWRSTILPKSDESFFTSINAKVTFANDGFEANESVKLLNEEKVVWFTDVKYHWTGFPGMKPLGKKEILELAKLPHNPDLKDPEMKWWLSKSGIWEFEDTIGERNSEQEREFRFERVTKRVDESHTVFINIRNKEILNIGVLVANPDAKTKEILRVRFDPRSNRLLPSIEFLDELTGTATFQSLGQRGVENRITYKGKGSVLQGGDSSSFAKSFSGSLKTRDGGKLIQIVKFKGEWVKELPAEGEELSQEWLEKKLAEIDSLEEAE